MSLLNFVANQVIQWIGDSLVWIEFYFHTSWYARIYVHATARMPPPNFLPMPHKNLDRHGPRPRDDTPPRHCEERSDAAIQQPPSHPAQTLDCRASLAMTAKSYPPRTPLAPQAVIARRQSRRGNPVPPPEKTKRAASPAAPMNHAPCPINPAPKKTAPPCSNSSRPAPPPRPPPSSRVGEIRRGNPAR
jgi:hypothetical protein